MSLFTAKELSKYSVTKALAEISSQSSRGHDGQVTGLELECSDAANTNIKRGMGTMPVGFLWSAANGGFPCRRFRSAHSKRRLMNSGTSTRRPFERHSFEVFSFALEGMPYKIAVQNDFRPYLSNHFS